MMDKYFIETRDGSVYMPFEDLGHAKEIAEQHFKETGERCYFIVTKPSGAIFEYLWPECNEPLDISDRYKFNQIYFYPREEFDGLNLIRIKL